jgi:hypothetical protein
MLARNLPLVLLLGLIALLFWSTKPTAADEAAQAGEDQPLPEATSAEPTHPARNGLDHHAAA